MRVSVIALLAVLLAVVAPAFAIIIEVPPNNQECVYETLTKNERMISSFEVIAGGMLDINIKARRVRAVWSLLRAPRAVTFRC